ncbi:Amino-acid permease RocC [Halomonadaceae bacterium LMG 33818]|uniref:amino acid permease n=1 Tax=Cernens ardua TaxID=3402176 RepID=UPI003EDB7E18
MAQQDSDQELKTGMQTRHMVMLALGGVIGTGLFLSSGYSINQAGPLGAVLAYAIGALVMYMVMVCLGELAVYTPNSGSFSVYATRYLGPGTGYTIAWLYWLNWTVAIGSEFTGAGMLMQHWYPNVPVWSWSLLFGVVILALNLFSVKIFAETEFWLSLIKVATVIVFLAVGIWLILGFPHRGDIHTHYLDNFTREGLFPTGIWSVFMTLVVVLFAFSGSELVGIASGEAEDPQNSLRKAIRVTIARLAIFFIGTIIVLAALIPREDANVEQSPFVTVFSHVGLPYVGDIMNLVILTAMLSAANSGLYASARMLWTLGNQGFISKRYTRVSRFGAPVNAVLLSLLGALASLASSIYAPGTVYLALISISGFASVVVWMVIAAAQMAFRRQYVKRGGDVKDLHYRVRFYPWVPIGAILFCLIACVGMACDPGQRISIYFSIPFIIWCYIFYRIKMKYRARKSAAVSEST